MRNRCLSPKSPLYKYYGQRGITICPEWDSFPQFLKDMGYKTDPLHQLERIDNSLGYSPKNCKWATKTEQQRNTRYCLSIAFRGKTQCLSAWAEELGVERTFLESRLRTGWTPEKAFTTPKFEQYAHRQNG